MGKKLYDFYMANIETESGYKIIYHYKILKD